MEGVVIELHPDPWKYCDFKLTAFHIYQWLEYMSIFYYVVRKVLNTDIYLVIY